MTKNEILVSIVKKISDTNKPPCKKTLQKIVYLIEEKEPILGFDYGIHFYGPYSSDLDFAVRQLNDEGILQIKYTRAEHTISVKNAKEFKASGSEEAVIDEVVSNFAKENPGDLELLATALYVFTKTKDIERIKEGVKKLKGSKYSDEKIENAEGKLKKAGYLAS